MMTSQDSLPVQAKLQALSQLRQSIELEQAKRKESLDRLQEITDNAAVVRERCYTFSGFVKEAWHVIEPGTPYLHNWHVDAIGEHLQAIHDEEIQRFLCNMPPGMMKSTTVSVMFGAWEWTKKPWLRYFTTSYEAGYAERDSRKHRDLVLSEWYQALWPGVKLIRHDASDFENTMKGGRKAVPFSRLTAGRGNRLIIDDPHSTEMVESPAELEKTTRMFRESATSRLNDQKLDALMIMMHRLHPKDLCGVIEELGLPYVKLILPMEYVRSTTVSTKWFTDPRTKEGELLHPERIGPEEASKLKITSGEHAWATQYQQMARAREGAFFFNRANILRQVGEELQPVPMPTRCDGVLAIMDTATKTGKKRDGTGTGWFALSMHPKPQGFVLDWDLRQVEADLLIGWLPSVMARGEELARRCGARNGFLGALIEDKDSGQILLQQAQRSKLRATPIAGAMTAMGKEGRAVSCSGYVSNNMMLMTDEAFEKTQVYKGRSANHFFTQVTEFRVGHGTPLDEDELFDIFCYANLLMFGQAKDAKGKK